VDAGERRPVRVLVQASITPQEIDTPNLGGGIVEAKCFEGDGDLGDPAKLGDPALGVPHAVPIHVELAAFVDELRVELRARGVRLEHVAVALVVEGVEHDPEGITRARIEVAGQVVDDELVRFGVIGDGAEIEILVVIENAHFRRGAGRLAFARIVLEEVGGERRITPVGLVEPSVDDDGACGAFGGETPLETRRLEIDGCAFLRAHTSANG